MDLAPEKNNEKRDKQKDPIFFREARLEDCAQVARLQERLGIEPDSSDDWQRIWRDNPFASPEHCVGWVLETTRPPIQIVGFLGNVPLGYSFGEKPIRAVAARGWVVEPEHRTHAMKQVLKYMSQRNVDLIINSSSNDVAFKIFNGLGSKILPQKIFGNILYWVGSPRSFLKSVFLKFRLPEFVAEIGAVLLAVFWQPILFLKLRTLKVRANVLAQSFELTTLAPESVNSENGPEVDSNTGSNTGSKIGSKIESKVKANSRAAFDLFWSQKKQEKVRLFADRSANALAWHMKRRPVENNIVDGAQAKPGLGPRGRIIVCRRKGDPKFEILGYLASIQKQGSKLGFVREQIVDLIALNDRPEVLEALLLEAYRLAQKEGVGALELMALPATVRSVAIGLKPFFRKAFPTPFTYKIVNPSAFNGEHQMAEDWYVSLYDGDSSL